MCSSRRRQILDAALRRFDHYGYRKTTMVEIAQEAGVSVGALYLIFKNKEDILLADAESRCQLLLKEMHEARHQTPTPVARLEAVNRTRLLYLNRLCASSPHGEELVRLLRDRFCDLHRGYLQQELRLLEEILLEGVAAGVFQIEDVPSTAVCCHAAFAAFLPPFSSGLTEQQLVRAAARMTGLLVNGLRAR